MKKAYEKLVNSAKAALKNAYSPYSKFKVGAAVLTGEGRIFTGANVENGSFGLTCCAERVAIYKAVSEGYGRIKAVAIVSSGKGFVTPCGACRQVIVEFNENADVVLVSRGGRTKTLKASGLLPKRFSFKK
ncbi:MAG: cytidine deaminase [Endomicrobiales bacterium]|nr:cytidine deaminase [Endomicrobiales bacterium]